MSDEQRTVFEKADFKRELTGVVPHLRAFARGLCGRPDMADDLVQETLLKAWAAQERFEPGTSMRAWTFVILRNAYLTDMRRNRFRGDYDETVAERILTAPAGQEEPIHLSDMRRALLTLGLTCHHGDAPVRAPCHRTMAVGRDLPARGDGGRFHASEAVSTRARAYS